VSGNERSQERVIHVRGSLEHNRPDSGIKEKEKTEEAVADSILHTENIQFRDF
jgi:hypothetical protein